MNPKVVYSSEGFESKYTYSGELGFRWSPEKTFFRLWAPTATEAKLCLFKSGDTEENDLSKDAKNDERVANVHVLSNNTKLTVVIVIEFRATDELVDYFKESNTLKGLVKDIKEDGTVDEIYNALKTAGLVHKNCIVAPIGFDAENVLKTIKEL